MNVKLVSPLILSSTVSWKICWTVKSAIHSPSLALMIPVKSKKTDIKLSEDFAGDIVEKTELKSNGDSGLHIEITQSERQIDRKANATMPVFSSPILCLSNG